MRLLYLFVGICALPAWGLGQDLTAQAWQLESKGDAAGARELLENAAKTSPKDTEALWAYADFLDRHRDPAARNVYAKLLDTSPGAAERTRAARRLLILDVIAGDKAAAERDIERYHAAGGDDLSFAPHAAAASESVSYIEIPGPLRSFARMAALSPDLTPDELLPALARNVVTNGYQAVSSNETLEQTEYLKLVVRYLSQARELERLAGPDKIVKIPACESTQTGDLLRVLGYRMRGGCGSDLVLETVNATRAFLTIDSGFPLAQLEEALRTNRPFTLDYHRTKVPLLYNVAYWQPTREKQGGEFIDYFLADPSLCRLYLGLSKLDPITAAELRKAAPVQRIKAFAHVLDFFGGMFQIVNGHAMVPGGARSERAWADLVTVSPAKGGEFFEKLLSKDDGWMASYFDALARIRGPVQDYLTEPERMKRFYMAIRGKVTSPGPARPVFRSNTDLMLLTARLHLDPNGKPHVPGGLEVWKQLFVNPPRGKYDAKLSKAAPSWKDSDDLLEALFGLCRKAVENEPLKIFMAISDMDRERSTPLEPATVSRLIHDYRLYGAQYPLLAEAHTVSDQTIVAFLDTAQAVAGIHDMILRADAAGTLQALVAIWQVFCRQNSIPAADADRSLAALLPSFAKVRNSRDVFDAGRSGVKQLLTAAHAPDGMPVQDAMLDLLAGAAVPAGGPAHQQVLQEMMRIFESQRLVSLQVLFDLADNLESVARGEKLNNALVARLVGRIAEIRLPQSSLSTTEKNSLAFGFWAEKHIDAERKINLRAAIDHSANDAEKLKELRGLLTPFLRDTLVGLDYIHYAPPGAQVLQTNPLFVRSHDFLGIQGANQTWKSTEVYGTGWPSSAGGRLVGSLASLPYALAEAEQNFLIPSREQALIWGDLVPQMILTAVVPRWWSVTPAQIHWVGIHMAYAETLLAEASLNADRRRQVLDSLERYAAPARVYRVNQLLASGDVPGALEQVTPSEMFRLAADAAASKSAPEPIAAEIRTLAADAPDRISYPAISRAFGTPKPTLTNSYQPELLNLRTFPTLMGYSSRIMAESWESSLLYYAALADGIHVPPAYLNVLIPQWTRQTVERIFATHLEDWPALLRSLRWVGEDVREKARKQPLDLAAGDN